MQAHKKDGRKIYFPTVNTIHREDKSETIKSMKHELEILGKRNEDLQRNNSETLIELEKIKRDNKKLYASTQDWYTKYNNAMSLIESRTSLFKTNVNSGEINLELSNSFLFKT
jgi:FtsZ-binding cell division protein ZapB